MVDMSYCSSVEDKADPKIKMWIMKKAWNTIFRWKMMGRAKRNVKETVCNFELQYINESTPKTHFYYEWLQNPISSPPKLWGSFLNVAYFDKLNNRLL